MYGRISAGNGKWCRKGVVALGTLAVAVASAHAAAKTETAVPTQVVVTVEQNVKSAPQNAVLQRDDVMVKQGRDRAQVVGWRKIDSAMDGQQIVILIDDSLQAQVSTDFDDLRNFILALPASTQVAVGYMQNGQTVMTGQLTTDHASVAKLLRLPTGIIGVNASPYFCVSDLVHHWPSHGPPAASKTVLLITDGIDRYYEPGTFDPLDPYVAAAIHDAQRNNLMVSSFYFRDRGAVDQGFNGANVGQNYLQMVADATGGTMYYEGIGNPVSFAPFVKDLQKQIANQYVVTYLAHGRGMQSVKVYTDLHHVKLQSQQRVLVGQQVLMMGP
jgi:hypothetical protein